MSFQSAELSSIVLESVSSHAFTYFNGLTWGGIGESLNYFSMRSVNKVTLESCKFSSNTRIQMKMR